MQTLLPSFSLLLLQNDYAAYKKKIFIYLTYVFNVYFLQLQYFPG